MYKIRLFAPDRTKCIGHRVAAVFPAKGGNLMNCGAVVGPCAERPFVVNGMKVR